MDKKKNQGKKTPGNSFRCLHSEETVRRFEHVRSKVGLYIANLPPPRVLSNSNRSGRQGYLEMMSKMEKTQAETSGCSTSAAAAAMAAAVAQAKTQVKVQKATQTIISVDSSKSPAGKIVILKDDMETQAPQVIQPKQANKAPNPVQPPKAECDDDDITDTSSEGSKEDDPNNLHGVLLLPVEFLFL